MSADTPLMRQYLQVKARHPDCIVFFRVGDFYEMFFDDALTASRALDLTLTSRDKGKEDPTPMCGVPHHAAHQYLGKLVERGFKVAVCDQVEDPKLAQGIVRREVTQVVTPGVLLDENQLEAKANCYLVALHPEGDEVGLAYLDVSTGEFGTTQLARPMVEDELGRLGPRELLLAPGALTELRRHTPVSEIPPSTWDQDRQLLIEALGASVAELGLDDWPAALQAAAMCVRYARATQPTGQLPLHRLAVYRPSDHLILDETAIRNLELFGTLNEGRREGSLWGLLDRTQTAMGGRLLRRWLAAPLCEVAAIRRRHDAVEWLVERATLRANLRVRLREVYDLERLAGRLTLGVATPRDLVALARSLEELPPMAVALAQAEGPELARPELVDLGDDLAPEVAAEIRATLLDDPPALWREGGILRPGCSPELDELAEIADGGKRQIAAIEARERERTGIASLKVRYNRVFGYYLEITRSNLERVPTDYLRKQTLANAERYVTPELQEYETKVLGAEERRVAIEMELFTALRSRLAQHLVRLQALSARIAELDSLASLAETAHTLGYVRPEVDDGATIDLVDGRHPVVERMVQGGFVANDLTVTADPEGKAQLLVLTGPNMAGKSTVMRQVALCTLLAQIGSFVPAKRARIGLCDRIFTRVGASDQLSRGDSTFMVEMRETAAILRHATRRSLVILDEIGRGTSTFDGLSIAWAVAEHLCDRVGARTLFATHYHELTALAELRPGVRNLQVAVREGPDGVVFLHRLVPGGASRSYGIEVARLAGLPRAVIERARQMLSELEQRGERTSPQLSLFSVAEAPLPSVHPEIIRRLEGVDLDALSPRAAHALLTELHALLQS